MNEDMRYTDEEVAVIDAVIGSCYSRMIPGSPLQAAYWDVHRHLEDGIVSAEDLRRIESALEFTDPGYCTSCHKEGYREMTTLLLKTKSMLRAAKV